MMLALAKDIAHQARGMGGGGEEGAARGARGDGDGHHHVSGESIAMGLDPPGRRGMEKFRSPILRAAAARKRRADGCSRAGREKNQPGGCGR